MQPIVMPAVTAFSTFSTRISRSTVLAPTSRGLRPGGLARPCAARLLDTARRLYHVRGEREANGERAVRRREPAGVAGRLGLVLRGRAATSCRSACRLGRVAVAGHARVVVH